ncbi:MAG: 2-dehydropantoate 2-reductase [Candidatus Omnitrophota bacterium]
MKIAVIGAGAIGGLVAGYLKAKDEAITLVGRPDAVRAIKENGLLISGVRGDFKFKIEAVERLSLKPDLVILAVKTQDIEVALKDNQEYIQGALVLTTQNGLQADEIVSRYAPKEQIISSIVMFGATALEPGSIVHNFEGPWIIGRIFASNDAAIVSVSNLLNKAFAAIAAEEIKGMKLLKLFVNANNCIPAILGLSMQEAFSDVEISRIAMAIWREGLEVTNRCGMQLVSLPDFPLERLTKLTSLPLSESTKIYSGIMLNLSKEPLYGSILQSIKRGKKSEIDYINGEFVHLAQKNQLVAPLNEKLVEMVHGVERNNKFFSPEELKAAIGEMVN